ncbi:MAG: hypothetical protein A2722_02565 [Candidatus Doudnabacteria bacterium RIFCSPHIGHO2_01_FULL_50_11]|uniref:Uncharacterized protein n=1 Tax=Candidatus Doudnabacteria bacterium RIFCSPHIGHO2_01_FULL_50_11 TaxID=1817828 RepID=A0A1F5PMA9_9BACT|nr:MAG: hypothetical protein A2722_02565 [Candidatus Doudnabacteria bacterium RIFCSPHIGHO2_01_FULL_50_11]HLC45053.1 hypothetical protein [Patescibacteria group bacterium]
MRTKNFMSSYQKKYISLKDAAIISGYTVSELKNFTKIGLVPSRKRGKSVYIRFDAFEKINDRKKADAEKKSMVTTKKPAMQYQVGAPAALSLIPFTKPHPTLVKILEPVAFTAALVMVLHLTMIPTVSEKIVWGLDLSADTVAFMGDTTAASIAATVSLPDTLSAQLAAVIVNPEYSGSVVQLMPQVAGVSISAEKPKRLSIAAIPEGSGYGSSVDSMLISIADASDNFQTFLTQFSDSTERALVGSLTFDNLDQFVTTTFRW